jgi:hypothetical protein
VRAELSGWFIADSQSPEQNPGFFATFRLAAVIMKVPDGLGEIRIESTAA